ncbi:TRAP transporter large permease [Virgibacillus byunsanensis]|uniref:TRAP transporter large permease n=1 Tax=Virgibacillus byunsanensis TaxID=570945 RepID=A0ABW3LLZ6_9BACI
MALLILITLISLLALSVPIAVSIGLSTVIAVLYVGDIPLSSLAQKSFTALDSFPLMAIPFFIMAGTIMEYGGISKRLINFANTLVGSLHGGLAMVAVLASLLFGAMSGSGIATTAAIGAILIPSMVKKGYDKSFAGATQAISGELGVIIPPSINMVVFGVTVGVSVGDLFIAGIAPGFLMAISLIIGVYVISKIKGYTGESNDYTIRQRLAIFIDAIPALLMPVIILGGIYSGNFTPTEAAAVAIAYALVISLYYYREIKLKDIFNIFIKSSISSATIMYIMANAGLFTWILSFEGIPQLISEYFTQLTSSPLIFLLIINVMLLLFGMFIDGLTAIIILGPLLMPTAIELGIDPIHFGIIMIINLALGMCTPPVGIGLFVASQISNSPIEKITKAIIPFLAIVVINLIVLSLFPEISLFLVELLDK